MTAVGGGEIFRLKTGPASIGDYALADQQHALEAAGRHAQIVGGGDHGDVFRLQAIQHLENFVFRRRIDAAERFVKQQYVGFLRQCPRDKDALALSAAQLTDPPRSLDPTSPT